MKSAPSEGPPSNSFPPGQLASGPGAAAAAPELLQLLLVAGEQVAVTVGDAGNGARRGAVGGLVGALVGHVLPELPAAVRPGKRHLGLLARVGDPQVALRQDRITGDRYRLDAAPRAFAIGP